MLHRVSNITGGPIRGSSADFHAVGVKSVARIPTRFRSEMAVLLPKCSGLPKDVSDRQLCLFNCNVMVMAKPLPIKRHLQMFWWRLIPGLAGQEVALSPSSLEQAFGLPSLLSFASTLVPASNGGRSLS
jgi:hypothetical protein